MHTKFSRPIRILKKYTAISQNQPPTYPKGRFLPGNLFDFYEKQNKFLGSPGIPGLNGDLRIIRFTPEEALSTPSGVNSQAL